MAHDQSTASEESTENKSYELKLSGYFITCFLTSGALLVIELVAARIIAPYVGVSLYTWTTIIGVILAGLSIGNWLGGYWADKGHAEKRVGVVIFGSGLLTLLSLFLIQPVAAQVQAQDYSLLTSTLIYVLSLFLFPSMALGVITPMLTTLAARQSKDMGKIIGGMHAIAALGSITGVFLTGYILIQYFGSRQVIFGVAILLMLLSVPYYFKEKQSIYVSIAAVLLITMVITAFNYKILFVDICKRESAYYCINVVDRSEDVTFGTAQGLVIDHLLHGINHATEPGYLVAAFAQA
ncbi:MAG: fused MFS/spermidine synthase, partial [Gammaproteobacteria bacterium]